MLACFVVTWMLCSVIDAMYTPRDKTFRVSAKIHTSYQWCMVGYASNLILTLLKVIFETNRSKMHLHLVSCYINLLAAASYALLWTGFSPIVPDVESCLYVPQRWLLYCFTAPAIIYILCQISDYSPCMRVWVILLNVFMLAAGGLGTVPWISWEHKMFWYVMSCVPFPSILCHMWRMVSSAVDETVDGASKRSIKFIRIFSITTWNLFPIVYFGAIDGSIPLEISEPLWAALDWLTKMVYSSSLMEANFLSIAQRREFAVKAVEEANRLQTIQQLSNAIERKDDFLSTMSHELRTPLNGIIGLSESMMAGACGTLPEKALQTVSTVRLSGKRLLQLINDILDAAKMKQGTLVIKHEKVDIKRLVTDVVDLSLPLVRKGVKLVNNVGNVPKIVGDAGRIVQILYNLVGNAAKFTRTGVISITAGMSEDSTCVYVSVADTGVGIPKEKVSKIFGAFEQADMSTTRRYGGTGLGLHLVKELVKAHNGDITVESTVGQGSTFTVWLPISQEGVNLPVVEDVRSDNQRRVSDDEESVEDALGRHTSLDVANMRHSNVRVSMSAASAAAASSQANAESNCNTSMARMGAQNVPRRGGSYVSEATVVRQPRTSTSKGENSGGNNNGGRNSTQDHAAEDTLLSVSTRGFKVMKPFYREKHGGCMVLSVDDDPINQMVVDNLLSPEGYKVEQALGGQEALDFLHNSPTLPDVILLDIMMPDMSGYEVCQEIRRRYAAISIPIIMVSAKGHPEHVMKGLEAGSVDYVKKPFHRQELLSRVRAQVRNREIMEAEMESRKVTDTLKRIMPLSVIQRLQQGQSMIADQHDDVTVLFADLAGFWDGTMAQKSTTEAVTLMNEMYAVFEKLLAKHQVFRVEHCGDAYTAVSGHDGTRDHLHRMLALAQDMLNATQDMRFSNGEPLRIRIGVHTGPAYAGVVGIEAPKYCVFGDTVTIANCLERSACERTVQCSESVVAKARFKDSFVKYCDRLEVGTHVLGTYMLKVGNWEAALKESAWGGAGGSGGLGGGGGSVKGELLLMGRSGAPSHTGREREGPPAGGILAAAMEDGAVRDSVMAQLKAKVAELSERSAKLAAEREALEIRCGELQAHCAELRNRLAMSESDNTRLRLALDNSEAQAQSARLQLANLQQQQRAMHGQQLSALQATAGTALVPQQLQLSPAPGQQHVYHVPFTGAPVSPMHMQQAAPLLQQQQQLGMAQQQGYMQQQQHMPQATSPAMAGVLAEQTIANNSNSSVRVDVSLTPGSHPTLSSLAQQAAAMGSTPVADRIAAASTPLAGSAGTVASASQHPGQPHGVTSMSGGPGGAAMSARRSIGYSPSHAESGVESEVPYHGYATPPGGGARTNSIAGDGVSTTHESLYYPIEDFLADIGLSQYVDVMIREDVTPLVLATLAPSELEALGVETLGARKRMLEAAQAYAARVQSTAKMMALMQPGATGPGGVGGAAARNARASVDMDLAAAAVQSAAARAAIGAVDGSRAGVAGVTAGLAAAPPALQGLAGAGTATQVPGNMVAAAGQPAQQISEPQLVLTPAQEVLLMQQQQQPARDPLTFGSLLPPGGSASPAIAAVASGGKLMLPQSGNTVGSTMDGFSPIPDALVNTHTSFPSTPPSSTIAPLQDNGQMVMHHSPSPLSASQSPAVPAPAALAQTSSLYQPLPQQQQQQVLQAGAAGARQPPGAPPPGGIA